MTKLLFSAAAIAMFASNPAAAQLLGGGALGGSLGGSLNGALGGAGGSLGGMGNGSFGGTLDRAATDTAAIGATRSTRIDKSVDRRTGKVSASGSHSGDTSLANGSTIAGRTIGTNAGLADSASGNMDAQLVGTDAVRDTAQQAVGAARGAAQSARTTAQGARSAAGSAVSNAANYAGPAAADGAATGAGSASSGGMLALAGSSAANGAGSFGVSPGMIVSDAKGRAIGTVRDVRTTASGAVREVVMKVGDRTATLPASNFSGAGSVLVSAMGKGDVKHAAKEQPAAHPAR